MSDLISVVSLNKLEVEARNPSESESGSPIYSTSSEVDFESDSLIYSTSSEVDTDSEFNEKTQEVRLKPDESYSKTALTAYLCIGLLIVTGFYAILGVFIDYYLEKQAEAIHVATQDISLNQLDISTCSSKSYLMSDHVCDDVTNTKACFFDGGDCCLEDKETIYCTDCLCRHDVGNFSVFSLQVDNNAKVFKLSRNQVQLGGLYFPALLFKLVHGPATCHKLCFEDFNDTDIANGWLFQSRSLTCQCINMQNTDFCVDEEITEDILDDLDDVDMLAVYKDSAKPICNCQEMLLIGLGDTDASFHMFSSDKNCHANFSHPLPKLESPIVTLVDSGSILFCGGTIEGTISPKCYFVEDNIVAKEVKMVLGVVGSAGILLEDNMILTGGKDEHHTPRAISQYISINRNQEENKRGPELPFAVFDHCFKRITHNKAIIIGGTRQDSENSNRTLVFHSINSTHQSWTLGPKMLVPRTRQSCGVIHIQESKRRLLIVAAGVTPGLMFPTVVDHSTEILTVSEDDIENARFVSGPDIPAMDDIHGTAIVVSFDHHSLFLATTLSQGMAVFQFNVVHFEWAYRPAISFQLKPRFGDFFALSIPKLGSMDSCEFIGADQLLLSDPPQNWVDKESLIWRQVGNVWYYFGSNDNKQTWENALKFCLSLNASLPEIRDGKDHEALIARSRLLGVQAFWIGIIKNPISKSIMYLSDGANFNLTEHLPKDFTNLDDQILLMVDTMTGMWQAKPGSLISNVVCQSGLRQNLAFENISEVIQIQEENDTCCHVISLEHTSPFLFNNHIFGRYKRTVKSFAEKWSYTQLGIYENNVKRDLIQENDEESLHQDKPPGIEDKSIQFPCLLTLAFVHQHVSKKSFPQCWEDQGHQMYMVSCDNYEVGISVSNVSEHLSCSRHENGHGQFCMIGHRRFHLIQDQYVTFSHKAKWHDPIPNCVNSVTDEQHFEPRSQESMTEALTLARNLSIVTFWLGILFDQQLDRFVYQSDGSAIQVNNFEPDVMDTKIEDPENNHVYVNVTNGMWSLSDVKIPRHNLCVAQCQQP